MPGLSDIRVTLYDIFGYLLPGLVAFGAVVVFVWATVFPTASLHEPKLTGARWIAVFVVSYVLGHLVQAIANMIPLLRPSAHAALAWLPPLLRTAIEGRVRLPAPTGASADPDAHALQLFELCDIAVAQKGSTGDREIYQYREGFYRGLVVAFGLGILATIVRASVSGDALVGPHHFVTGGEYLLVCAILGVAAVLSYHRYLRFFTYKLHNAYGAFAVEAGIIEVPPSS